MQTIIKLNETFTGPKKKEELWWMLPIDAGYNQQHDIWTKFFQGCTRNFDKIVFRQENSEKYTSNYYDEKTGYFELSGDTNVANQPQSDESYLNTPNDKEAMFLHKVNDKGENEYKFIGIFERRAYIKSMNKYIFVRVDTDLVCEMN